MKLLVLSPMVPWPLDHGGRIRIFNILRERSRRHRITLACLSPAAAPDLGPLPDLCDETVVVRRPSRPLTDLAAFLAGRRPYNLIRYRSRTFAERLAQLTAKQEFDQVQVELPMMWQYADACGSSPKVLSTQNIEGEVIRELRASCRSPLKRRLYGTEERRLQRFERRAWEESAACIVVSEGDRKAVAACVSEPSKVHIVANGVDLERFPFEPRTAQADKLLVLGGMDYFPNRNAAEWFADEVFPAVRQRRPSAEAALVGRGTESLSAGRRGRGIDFVGDVPDVRPWLRQTDLLVVPLRIGGGTRLKILEAMAAGLPVVCTPKACEGLEAVVGEHLAVAETAEGLAGAAAALLEDRSVARAMAERARSLVESKYGWPALTGGFEGLPQRSIREGSRAS